MISIGYDEGGNYYIDCLNWQDEIYQRELCEQVEGEELETNRWIESIPFDDKEFLGIDSQYRAILNGWAEA